MKAKTLSLVLLGVVALCLCACSGKAGNTAADVNNKLSAPEHVNTSTEPAGKGSTTATPASSK
jgi:ABC-type phosphate transport system substrate-binding protein